jgi:hypothetical protein
VSVFRSVTLERTSLSSWQHSCYILGGPGFESQLRHRLSTETFRDISRCIQDSIYFKSTGEIFMSYYFHLIIHYSFHYSAQYRPNLNY